MSEPELAEILSFIDEVFSKDEEGEVTTELVRQGKDNFPGVSPVDCIRTFEPVSLSGFDAKDSTLILNFRLTDGTLAKKQ